MPEETYHRGPELSKSGAKDLLKSPALYDYRRTHPEHKDAWDLGTVTHGLILGTGWDVVIVDAEDWRGKAAREQRDEARAASKVAILAKDHQRMKATADAVLLHPLAGRMLEGGQPEASVFWTDDTGDHEPVRCRARFDYLHPSAGIDVKTCMDASPAAFTKSVVNFAYDMQAFVYPDGLRHVTGELLPFLFIAVEKEPPHQVAVYDLDFPFIDRGERHWRDALASFAACNASGVWPGYPADIQTLSAPRWAA
jgi:hypothetical protein